MDQWQRNGLIDQLRDKVILVADHEPWFREYLESLLGSRGLIILSAQSGEQAVRIFEQHREVISCVLMSISLPKLSGVEAYNRMLSFSPEIPAVLMSGQLLETPDLDVKKKVSFLAKPFDVPTLFSMLLAHYQKAK